MTARPPSAVDHPIGSCSSRPAQAIVITGWTSWTWLTCDIGPMASPRYHAKKPRNMLTTPR